MERHARLRIIFVPTPAHLPMKKCIIRSNAGTVYSAELAAVKADVADLVYVDENALSTDFLLDHNIDVVLSAGLTDKWLDRLRQLQIVSLVLGPLAAYQKKCDIVVDCVELPSTKFLTGADYSSKNPDFDLMELADLIHKMKFDSDFFGVPIAYVTSRYLTPSILYRIRRFIAENGIGMVEYLCNCHDDTSVQMAERDAFHFTDIRMSLVRKIAADVVCDLPEGIRFDLATNRDIAKLREIGEGLYLDSRYYFDGHFPVEKISEFYRGWIEKGVLGLFDDCCLCLYSEDEPIAFCTLRFKGGYAAKIGLVGVSSRFQGKGMGNLLLCKVINFVRQQGVSRMDVVTQGRNYPAQKLYQSVGFRVLSNELWYHKWI